MASRESERVATYWTTVKRTVMDPQPDHLVTNDQWDVLTAEPRGVDYREVDADGVPALWAEPHGTTDDSPVLLAFHGGGYIGGSMFTHRKMFAHLAKAIGARALVVDYTLLPQGGTYPRPVTEGLTAYRWLLDQGIPANRIAFTGDSAGGQLSITVQLHARAAGLPLPAAALLISPWTDLELTGESMDYNAANDALFTRDWIQEMTTAFLAGTDPRDPQAAPLYADLTGFGPIYIQAGDQEMLLDDSNLLAQHAEKAGIPVHLEIFPGQQHTFQMAAGLAPEADEALTHLAAWARPKLGRSAAQ